MSSYTCHFFISSPTNTYSLKSLYAIILRYWATANFSVDAQRFICPSFFLEYHPGGRTLSSAMQGAGADPAVHVNMYLTPSRYLILLTSGSMSPRDRDACASIRKGFGRPHALTFLLWQMRAMDLWALARTPAPCLGSSGHQPVMHVLVF